jgi:hypothetical protein
MSTAKDKLYNIEVTPPGHCWEKIAAKLDEPVLASGIAEKLLAAEIVPPASVWEKIEGSLDENKAIRKRPGLVPILRYAAAAVVIGLIAFGIFYIQGNKTNSGSLAKNEPKQITQPIAPVAPVVEDKVTTTDEARNDAALEQSKKTYAKLDRKKKPAAYIHYRDDISSNDYADAAISNENITDRYIVLMTPDGHFIRMSKKLSDLVCCVSGEEQDKDCIDQMEKWRKQLACSSSTHPGNFGDILSLVSSLQED